MITNFGDHVDNRTVEFTIKNQPFTSYDDASGNHITLYYNFRSKGYYGDVWTCFPFDGSETTVSYGMYTTGDLSPKYPASGSAFTVITINLGTLIMPAYVEVSSGVKMDFQVQALFGHIEPIPSGLLAGDFYQFTGESSDWSNTQTISIGEKTPDSVTTPDISPLQNSTTTFDQPRDLNQPDAQATDPQSGFNWIEIAVFAVLGIAVALLVGVVALMRRRIQVLEQKIGDAKAEAEGH